VPVADTFQIVSPSQRNVDGWVAKKKKP